MTKAAVFILMVLFMRQIHAQWLDIDLGREQGYRALEFVNEDVVLLAGSNASVLLVYLPEQRIIDISPKMAPENMEFRSAVVLNAFTYLVASAGFPSVVYLTEDEGHTWTKVFSHSDSAAFIDGGTFIKDRVVFYGDPIQDEFLYLEAKSPFTSFQPKSIPKALKDEAGFAASDAGLIHNEHYEALAFSSPKGNRVLVRKHGSNKWKSFRTNLIKGEGAGIFAMDFVGQHKVLLVGGSYLKPDKNTACVAQLDLRNGELQLLDNQLGYRSGVACYRNSCISTGPNGTALSNHSGSKWEKFKEEQYYTVKQKKGTFALSGPHGRFAIYKLTK